MKCPCHNCLIEMVCVNPCDKFDPFGLQMFHFENRVSNFLQKIDETFKISNYWFLEKPAGFLMDWVLGPIIMIFIKLVYKVKIPINPNSESTRFDKRYNLWNSIRNAK
jgi:hypothetical protein